MLSAALLAFCLVTQPDLDGPVVQAPQIRPATSHTTYSLPLSLPRSRLIAPWIRTGPRHGWALIPPNHNPLGLPLIYPGTVILGCITTSGLSHGGGTSRGTTAGDKNEASSR
ncbi:hypothetical protein VUR80DRAFT_8104 [Thermomyces stellatus]